jgi:hypothetical protein
MSELGCALVRLERRAACGAARGTLVALHADGGGPREVLPHCEPLARELDVVAPQAPRARNPFLSSAPPDDPRWRDYAGYSWFRRDAAGRPEPASYGDSLAQLEKLALELHEAGRAPLYLFGVGEGETLARELEALRPDLFEGSVRCNDDGRVRGRPRRGRLAERSEARSEPKASVGGKNGGC